MKITSQSLSVRAMNLRLPTLLIMFMALGQFAAAAGQLAPCEGISGNLVQNCGFETGDFTGWTQSGNTDSTFVFDSFDGFSPNSGSEFAALGPAGTDGYLSQTITTIPGNVYSISWYLASDAQTPNDLNITWDGTTIFSQSDLVVPDWTLYSFSEIASAGSTNVTIGFSDDLGYLALDDVSITDSTPPENSTPEPATLPLLAVSALGLIRARQFLRRDLA